MREIQGRYAAFRLLKAPLRSSALRLTTKVQTKTPRQSPVRGVLHGEALSQRLWYFSFLP